MILDEEYENYFINWLFKIYMRRIIIKLKLNIQYSIKIYGFSTIIGDILRVIAITILLFNMLTSKSTTGLSYRAQEI